MWKIITSELNSRSHKIQKATKSTWKQAFHLAVYTQDLPEELLENKLSIFQTWNQSDIRALAGHFWGLSKAYDELQDKGRAIAMYKVSKRLYDLADTNQTLNFKIFVELPNVASSTKEEALEFFKASANRTLTPRSVDLITTGALNYASKIKRPEWRI